MPESVSGVDEILRGLRGRQLHPRPGQIEPRVYLADAEAAVRDARDATVKEIVELLGDPGESLAGVPMTTRNRLADSLARRFPNGGTHDGR